MRLADRRLTLEVTEAAREWLAIEGYDPAYGARPLRRLIQTEIGDQLARMLLGGQVHDGDTVVVDRPHYAVEDQVRQIAAGEGGVDPNLATGGHEEGHGLTLSVRAQD